MNGVAPDPEHVPERARRVAELNGQSLDWLVSFPQLARAGEVASFRRYRREARRLSAAAMRPACVAVFGASQSGKSYLVGSLARPADRSLAIRYGDTTLDFLTDMNPFGSKESTGLVSRFTARPPSPPAGAPPVPVRLISRSDVVRIVANTFLSDFQLRNARPVRPDAVAQLLGSLGGGGGSGFDIDDIEELQRYFSEHFYASPVIQGLGDDYWLQLAERIGQLSADSCIEAFSPLWGGIPEFNRLAGRLLSALDALGASDLAFCEVAALLPRAEGILNVAALSGLGLEKGGEVRVVSQAGRACRLDRSVLAAIVAELVVPLDAAPWPFLERVDLLDFPGARTRDIIEDLPKFFANPEALGRSFLRGKVEFLFQRYQAEGEITAMLLCVGESVQEVQVLPRMVNQWVENTIGRTPQERARQRDSLFVVLTKFDREFERKAGEDHGAGDRWSARIGESLVNFFKTSSWVGEWRPGQPFDNTSWLRSTAVAFDAVFDYEERPDGRRERMLSPRAADMVGARRAAYLANELVQRHIGQAARAWDEALQPNDGGISFLAERLELVCDRRAKLEQVAAQVERLATAMAAQLRPHHRSGDVDAEVRKARQQARTLAGALTQCAAAQMFGPMVRALVVSRDQMVSVWRAMQNEPEAAAVPVGLASDASKLLADMFGDLDDEVGTGPAKALAVRDLHYRFAQMVIEEWTRLMNCFVAEPAAEQIFRISADQAEALVAALGATASRLNLVGRLASRLRTTCGHHSRITSTGEKQAAIAAAEIGDFVTMLGYAHVAEAERPVRLDERTQRVFATRPPADDLPDLGEVPGSYTERFVKDWISALFRRFEENAGAPELGGDPVANARLGTILAGLERAS